MNRRQWLQRFALWTMVGSAFAILGGILLDVWRAAGLFSTSHWREVGRLADFPRDGTYPLPAERIAVVRKGGRLAAISLECTHLGCLVNTLETGFFCPCHGSEFGPLGEVYTGPAQRSLPWSALRLRRGRIWIRTGALTPEPDWLDLPLQSEEGRA